MDRFLVAYMAVTLLLSGAEHGRADYVSTNREGGSAGGGRRFLDPLGNALVLPGDFLLADALNQQIQVYLVTGSGSLQSGDRQLFEPGGMTAGRTGKGGVGDSPNAHPGQFESDVATLADSGCLGIGGARALDPFRAELAWSIDRFIAHTYVQRTDPLSGDDQFLAKFGGLDVGPNQVESPRFAIDLTGSSSVTALILQYKLLLGLSFLGLVVLGILAYVWRQQKVLSHRGLRGPRGAAVYRSSIPTNPRGTMR